jgi:hypothetical protein
MSMPDPPAPASRAYVCPLCGTPVGSDDERCRACNMTLAGIGQRAEPFSRHSWWRWGAGLLAIYLAVLLLVVAVR